MDSSSFPPFGEIRAELQIQRCTWKVYWLVAVMQVAAGKMEARLSGKALPL